jgi:hypothetical protein
MAIKFVEKPYKRAATLKGPFLIFIHIESSVTLRGSSRRNLARKSWLKFADAKWVDYRFFLASPSPRAHPNTVRKTMTLIRHEQRASVMQLGHSDLVLREKESIIEKSLAWAQWSVLWADFELGLSSRFKFYLRVSDDSMVCLPQLLAELTFRPELREGPVFWGKFWCVAGVSVRPEEYFMLFSSDIIRFLVFDWTSKNPLIPYDGSQSLSQNFGFFAMFLNASIVDDRSRLSGAQDMADLIPSKLSLIRRRPLSVTHDDSNSTDVDAQDFSSNTSTRESGAWNGNATAYLSDNITMYVGSIFEEESASPEYNSNFNLLTGKLETANQENDNVEVYSEPGDEMHSNQRGMDAGIVNSARNRGVCNRLIFLYKPGGSNALSAMVDGLKEHFKSLSRAEGDDIAKDDDHHTGTIMKNPDDFVKISRWQLRSFYRQHEYSRPSLSASNRVADAPYIELLRPPCADAGLATSGSNLLLSQFGARHRSSVAAFVDTVPSVKSHVPMTSLAFRSNLNRNPFKIPSPFIKHEALNGGLSFGSLAGVGVKPEIKSKSEGNPSLRGAPPRHQQGGEFQNTPRSAIQQTIRKSPLPEVNNVALKTEKKEVRVKGSSIPLHAPTSIKVAINRFQSSIEGLAALTPAGQRLKINAAVERTLKKYGLGDVQGSPEELLELAAVATSTARQVKQPNRGVAPSVRSQILPLKHQTLQPRPPSSEAEAVGRSAADEIMAQLSSPASALRKS